MVLRNQVRLRQTLSEPLPELLQLHSVGRLWNEESEFVAADSRSQVEAPRLLPQAQSELRQHAVRYVVAVSIIDALKAIDVDAQDGELSAGFLSPAASLLEMTFEFPAVR